MMKRSDAVIGARCHGDNGPGECPCPCTTMIPRAPGSQHCVCGHRDIEHEATTIVAGVLALDPAATWRFAMALRSTGVDLPGIVTAIEDVFLAAGKEPPHAEEIDASLLRGAREELMR